MKRLALLLLLLPAAAQAQYPQPAEHPALATMRVQSHGGSATCIMSVPPGPGVPTGRSWLLSCGHLFFAQRSERIDQGLLSKPLKIDGPQQPLAPSGPHAARVLAYDAANDLSLMEVDCGPWDYLPVAPRGHRPSSNVASCGFDELKWPAKTPSATLMKVEGSRQWTQQPPWHGRSGGGLIDVSNRMTIGVVQAYTMGGPGGRPQNGLYASHESVLAFLEGKCGWRIDSAPQVQLDPNDRRYFPQAEPITPQTAPVSPFARLDQQNRLPNRTGSQCVWVSLSACALQLGVSGAADLHKSYGSVAGPEQVASALSQRGVHYEQVRDRSAGMDLIRRATAAGRPVMIGLSGSHAIVCLGVDGDTVRVVDNGGPHSLQDQDWTMAQFRQRFDGWVVVLMGEVSAAPSPSPRQPQGQGSPSCPGGNCPVPQRQRPLSAEAPPWSQPGCPNGQCPLMR